MLNPIQAESDLKAETLRKAKAQLISDAKALAAMVQEADTLGYLDTFLEQAHPGDREGNLIRLMEMTAAAYALNDFEE